MNSFQIRCFLEAAREGNFSRAAQRLFISQPGISRHIASLEKELQVRLFQRSANKRIQLTEAGRAYYGMFQRFEQESEALAARFRVLESDPFGQLRFGYMAGWDISFFLPQMLAKFDQTHPGVMVKLISMSYTDLFAALAADELDVILLPQDYLIGVSDILWQEVLPINRLILYSNKLLETVPHIESPRDLRDVTFYVPDDTLLRGRGERMENFARDFGFHPKLRNVGNIETVMAYVKGGVGVTFSDSWGRSVGAEGFGALPLPKARTVVLAWPANITHALPHLIVRELRAILTGMQDDDGCFPAKRLFSGEM